MKSIARVCSHQGAQTRRLAWIVSVTPPFLAIAVSVLILADPATAQDWQTYKAGSNAVLSGESPYAPWQLRGPYALDRAAGGHGYVYPPSAAILLAPLIASPILLAAANLAVYTAGLLWLVRDRLTPRLASFVLWSVALHPAAWQNTQAGNVSALLAGGLAFSFATHGPEVVGLSAALKGFPAAWIVNSRRVKDYWVAAFAFVLPMAGSLVFVGIVGWVEFFQAVGNARASPLGMPTLVGLGVPPLLVYAIAIGMIAATPRLPPHLRLITIGLATLIAATDLPLHYTLLLTPGFVTIALRLQADRAADLPSSHHLSGAPSIKPRSSIDRTN